MQEYEPPTPDDVPRACRTPRVVVNPTPEGLPLLLRVVRRHKEVQELGTLHTLTFVTVDDYLFLLRALAKSMRVLGRHAMYYLAAAVSDFFLPRYKMVCRFLPTSPLRLKYLTDGSLLVLMRPEFSQNTKFKAEKAACSSRWIKYQKYSSHW